MSARLNIAAAFFPDCAATVQVNNHDHLEGMPGGVLTLTVRTGGATLQTYATPDELRALGELLRRSADEYEAREVKA